MSTVSIPRDLAERLQGAMLGLCAAHLPEYRELSAALSAPARPLTAEECSQFAKRVETVRSRKVSLMSDARRAIFAALTLALHLEDQEADALNAPAYHTPATPEDATQT